MPVSDDNIIAIGPCGAVECAIRADGTMPAKDGLDKLYRKRGSMRIHSRFRAMFKQLVLTGKLPNRLLGICNADFGGGPPIYRFQGKKLHPYRIPCFCLDNNRWLLTHVYKKRRGNTKENIRKAMVIRDEHLEHHEL